MTTRTKPPTNREMRANIRANIKDTSAIRRHNFDVALRAYENALSTPGTDQEHLAKLRKELVAKVDITNDLLDYYACIKFVWPYPDNDEPVKDEESKP